MHYIWYVRGMQTTIYRGQAMRTPPPGMWVHPLDIYYILRTKRAGLIRHIQQYIEPDEVISVIAEKIMATPAPDTTRSSPTTYGSLICYRYLISYARRHQRRWDQWSSSEDLPDNDTLGTIDAEDDQWTWMHDVLMAMPTDHHRAVVYYLGAGNDAPDAEEIRVRWGLSHREWKLLVADTKSRVQSAMHALGIRRMPPPETYNSIFDFLDSQQGEG
jgi:DNA-directed RNA polymerase specialized sigma24 family protein